MSILLFVTMPRAVIISVNQMIEVAGNQGKITPGNPLRASNKTIPVGKATHAFKNPRANLSSIVSLSFSLLCNIYCLITSEITRRAFCGRR